MTRDKRPLKIEDSNYLECLRIYGKKEADKLFKKKKKDEVDEKELASGSAELIEKSDAKLFPDEVEEYTEKESSPRAIVDNKPKNRKR